MPVAFKAFLLPRSPSTRYDARYAPTRICRILSTTIRWRFVTLVINNIFPGKSPALHSFADLWFLMKCHFGVFTRRTYSVISITGHQLIRHLLFSFIFVDVVRIINVMSNLILLCVIWKPNWVSSVVCIYNTGYIEQIIAQLSACFTLVSVGCLCVVNSNT